MEIGDKVFTHYVGFSDKGPNVLFFERRVVAVLDSGVVLDCNGNPSIHKHDKVFQTREAAAADALAVVRDHLAEVTSAHTSEMHRLLTGDMVVV